MLTKTESWVRRIGGEANGIPVPGCIVKTHTSKKLIKDHGPYGAQPPPKKIEPKLPSSAPALSRLFWSSFSRYCDFLYVSCFCFSKKKNSFCMCFAFLPICPTFFFDFGPLASYNRPFGPIHRCWEACRL